MTDVCRIGSELGWGQEFPLEIEASLKEVITIVQA